MVTQVHGSAEREGQGLGPLRIVRRLVRFDRERHDLGRPLRRPGLRGPAVSHPAGGDGSEQLCELLLGVGECRLLASHGRRPRRPNRSAGSMPGGLPAAARPSRSDCRRPSLRRIADPEFACRPRSDRRSFQQSVLSEFRSHVQRLMDVADEMREQPDCFRIRQPDVLFRRRRRRATARPHIRSSARRRCRLFRRCRACISAAATAQSV